MLSRVLGSQYGAKGKALAAVGIVGDGNLVGLAVPGNAMNARHLVATYAVNAQLVGRHVERTLLRAVGVGQHAKLPAVQTVHLCHQLLAQGDAGARWVVQLMNVVNNVVNK